MESNPISILSSQAYHFGLGLRQGRRCRWSIVFRYELSPCIVLLILCVLRRCGRSLAFAVRTGDDSDDATRAVGLIETNVVQGVRLCHFVH